MNTQELLFRSGDLFLPKALVEFLNTYLVGDDTSLFYINLWTILHFLSGILTGALLVSYKLASSYFLTGFLIHTAWELWQIIGKNTPIWTTRGQIDVATDTSAFMLGMLIFLQLRTP